MDRRMYRQTDGTMYGISSHFTELCPQLGLLPKKLEYDLVVNFGSNKAIYTTASVGYVVQGQ